MRNLAHVEEIKDVRPIPNADQIEVATVLGWDVVVKKDEYKIGDKCIYIEIDSIVPDIPYFDFMKNKDFKVKTIKLRGQISQGLIVPLSLVPVKYHNVGADVTEVLKITKKDDSEIPSTSKNKWWMRYKLLRLLFGPKKKDKFPSWVKKTDETRVQNIPRIVEDRGYFIATEKVDGCSGTFTLKGNKYIVCSRNRIADKNSIYNEISEKCKIKEILKQFKKYRNAKYVTIQGEIVGPKIQGNKYQLKENEFYVFNIIIDGKRLSSLESASICSGSVFNGNGIKHVPIVNLRLILPEDLHELIKLADGKSQIADTLREGLVIRNNDSTISFKVISNEFLLKHKL